MADEPQDNPLLAREKGAERLVAPPQTSSHGFTPRSNYNLFPISFIYS